MLNNKKLLLIVFIAVAGFLFSGLQCFKDNSKQANVYATKKPSPTPTVLPTPTPTINPTTNTAKVPPVVAKELSDLVTNFMIFYSDYKWGDFSNLENLKPQMTTNYQKQVTDWVDKKKKELKKQPMRYIVYSAEVKNIDIVKVLPLTAEIKAEMQQNERYGTTVAGNDPIGPTTVWIDDFGNKTTFDKIVVKNYSKNFYLILAKENNVWKVDSVTEVQ